MSDEQASNQNESNEGSLITHLLELRDRLLRVVLAVLLLFAALFPFANQLYSIIADPLLAHMPSGTNMIAVEVITPFLTPLKLTFFAAIFLGMPFILHQFWAFVAPGLYNNEKRLAKPLLISSVFLFYAGVSFAYFVVFPLAFSFLVSVAPEGVAVMTDISRYLDFVLALFFAFGIAFEVPVATIILIATGITTAESLLQKRPYIIVGAFVIGMLLTPPDVISQVMLALPMWMLFELGIVMSRVLIVPKAEDDDDDINDSEHETKQAPAAESGSPDPIEANPDVTSVAAHESPEDNGATTSDTVAYPDDYEPLSEEELEAELDGADDWDEDDEDDKDQQENQQDEESSNTPEDADESQQASDDDTSADEQQEDIPNRSRDTTEYLDDIKKRFPEEGP